MPRAAEGDREPVRSSISSEASSLGRADGGSTPEGEVIGRVAALLKEVVQRRRIELLGQREVRVAVETAPRAFRTDVGVEDAGADM